MLLKSIPVSVKAVWHRSNRTLSRSHVSALHLQYVRHHPTTPGTGEGVSCPCTVGPPCVGVPAHLAANLWSVFLTLEMFGTDSVNGWVLPIASIPQPLSW